MSRFECLRHEGKGPGKGEWGEGGNGSKAPQYWQFAIARQQRGGCGDGGCVLILCSVAVFPKTIRGVSYSF